jgi:DNA polymerase-3 subunit beta
MPIKAPKNDLANALNWVSRALPSRPLIPVLGGIKMSLADNVLTVSALDNEQSAAAKINIEGENFEAVVAGRLFVEVVKSLGKDIISLEKDKEGRHLLVESGRSKFTIPLLSTLDYPDLPTIPETFGSISGVAFSEAVKQVSTAAGIDTSLPVLTAVFVKVDPTQQTLTLASTDRFRLATKTLSYIPKDSNDSEEKTFLIPAKTLDTYMKIFSELEEVKLHSGGMNNSIFGVSGGAKVATTNLLDGKFPAYESLLPSAFKASPEVDIAEMVSALKRVALVAEKAQSVKLTFDKNELQLSVGDISKSAQAGSEYLPTNYDEEASFTISFNPNYLADGLNAVGGTSAKFNLVEETKPVLLTSPDEDAYKYLIMPTRTN